MRKVAPVEDFSGSYIGNLTLVGRGCVAQRRVHSVEGVGVGHGS